MAAQQWILCAIVGAVLICGTNGAKINCVQCTSLNATDCANGTVSAKECKVDDDSCYHRLNGVNVERGCLKDLLQPDQEKCNNVTDLSCVTCRTAGCNKDKWLSCYTCDQTVKECAGEQMANGTAAVFCKQFKAGDTCYSKVDADKVSRGCASDLADVVAECTNFKYCESCEGNACNKLSSETLKTFTKCHRCKSTDAKCVNGTTEAVDCDKREDTCYTRIQNNLLERNCLSNLADAEQSTCKKEEDTTCVTCAGSGCNKASWLQCHQCKEATVAACAEQQTIASSAQFCKNYKDGNKCYERIETGKVVRGCETDLGSTEEACKNNTQCRSCSVDGCNKEASSTLLTVDRCLQCTTTVDSNGNCLTGKASSQPCVKASETKCYSKVDNNGVLKRGCQGDLTADEIKACTGKTCAICKNEGCNNAKFPADRLRCYQCKTTETDKTCADQLSGESKSSYCKLYNEKDQCYARITNGTFERGCQTDLGTTNACDGLDKKQCQLCSTENCNALSETKLKNSVGRSAASYTLVVFSTLVMFFGAFK